ncbi:MAG: tRNA(Ile2) 2-agmatinylcytidine synthetase, partial [Halobacteriaceae archaeon]
MTIIGIDDTDSREEGMCTTYVAAQLGEKLGAKRLILVRLNPAVEEKTRGNAALAVHTDIDPGDALDIARNTVFSEAISTDANPGIVITSDDGDSIPDLVS